MRSCRCRHHHHHHHHCITIVIAVFFFTTLLLPKSCWEGFKHARQVSILPLSHASSHQLLSMSHQFHAQDFALSSFSLGETTVSPQEPASFLLQLGALGTPRKAGGCFSSLSWLQSPSFPALMTLNLASGLALSRLYLIMYLVALKLKRSSLS